MNILIKPLVTEKMTDVSESLNQFGFVVDRRADKSQIKNAVERLYNVKVTSVNTMVYGGKVKSRFTRAGLTSGKTNAYKKAIVQVADGDTIDFYSNI